MSPAAIRPRAAVACLALAYGASASAAGPDPVAELGEVVISAPSADGTVRTTPHGVSIITQADIERSTATTVSDLLSREANLNLQSFFGNDKFAAVDMRGMGATAASNVLILVDGVRLNLNDQSAPDLSSIPLSQIERVEIVRGGGAVAYGNGAVGGVINIITKRTQPGSTQLDLLGRVASYSTTDLRVNAGAGKGPVTATVNLSKLDTDGYRQNGGVDAKDGMVELGLTPSGRLGFIDAYLRASVHHDTSGLPGPVSAAAFAADSAQRRASNFPSDYSSTDDRRYALGMNADFGRAGLLALQANYRERENPYILGFTPNLSAAAQQTLLTSTQRDFKGRYDMPFTAFGLEHSVSAGVDIEKADYARNENGQNRVATSTRRIGNVDSTGYYTTATLRGSSGLTLNAGVRYGRYSTTAQDQRYTQACQTTFVTTLVDIDPGPGVILVPVTVPVLGNCVNAYRTEEQHDGDWINRAAELGLTWQASRSWTVFGNVSKNFRNPNIDDLLVASDDLRPQTGTTYEAGLRYSPGERLALSATAFYMRIEDEIYYSLDPRTGGALNRNLDSPTRRYGTELEARWRALPGVALRASVGYLIPKISGTYADIPLVPRTTAYGAIEWVPREWLRGTFSVRYVGKRFDGDDFSNTRYAALPSYTVCDLALRLTNGNTQLSLGVNNVFNEVYSTIAYSNTYYPMPERNFYLELRWRL